MPKQNIIKPLEPTNDILDYAFLKKIGLNEIQKLSGKIWTDYNYHDPGITILEILAYALTELGYKSRYSVEDILTSKGKKSKDTLYRPANILPASPVTLTDLHKIILDIDGIKDVVIFPSKKFVEFTGVYDINIELFPEYDNSTFRQEIRTIVFEEAHLYRNLCEDIFEVNFIEHQKVIFEIDVSVNDKQDLKEIYLKIFTELIDYISPAVKFNSLQDMLDLGFKVEEIYNGPFLKSGFLTESEFERLDTRNIVSASDIIHFIMDIEGVDMINKLNIIDQEGKKHQWLLTVEKGKAFEVDLDKTSIRFFKFGKLVELNEDLSQEVIKIEKRGDNRLRFKKLSFDISEGVNRNIEEYNTIQNDFPEIYGIGELGLPISASNARKGQAKQLKAYLLFFEQILSNFYAQLANVHQIFSIDTVKNSYYPKVLLDIPGIEYLYKPFITDCIKQNIDISNSKLLKAEWKKNKEKYKTIIEKILIETIETKEIFLDRRNRVLDHLLARMAFNFSNYYYDFNNDSQNEAKIIKHKREILKDFVKLSKDRSRAEYFIDEFRPDGNKISGVEFIINKLLNLSSNSIKFPFEFYKNSFSLAINKQKQNKEHAFSFNFIKTKKDDALKNIFKYASNPSYFEFVNNKIVIKNEENVEFASLKNEIKKEEANAIIKKIAAHFYATSSASEAIFVLERILYRPLPLMKYFTFSVLDEKKQPVFINSGYLSYKERELRVNMIIKQGQSAENYTYKIISNQYKIILKNTEGAEILVSHHFFNTEQSLKDAINQQVETFIKIDNGQYDIAQYFNYYTKHYDLFHLIKNPYSFIVTVLIPNWPTKFQNDAFLSHLINIIKKEMPAHLSVDIKLVSVDKLLKIMTLSKEYKEMIRQEKPDYVELELILDELFGYLLEPGIDN